MKLFLLIFAILIFLPVFSLAQNSVTVTQKGNNNSVSIKQGALSDTAKANGCFTEAVPAANENLILLKKPGKSDTLFTDTGMQFYSFSKLFAGKNKLKTYQKGKENELYILLPDTSEAVNRLASMQSGKKNKASVWFHNSASSVNITQKGKGNTFILNPCETVEGK